MLLKPNIKLKRITDITPGLLKSRNIRGLILDVDNTLSTHHGQKLTDGLESWLALMRENGIALVILSNSKEINLPYVSLGLKPLPFKFRRALRVIKTGRKNTAIVGDQIFTDTLGGNLFGVTTILLDPIKPESSARFKFKRRLERAVFKIYKIKNTEVR